MTDMNPQTLTQGILEVGTNDSGEVVINHPDLQPDENGVGHIIFSPSQARNLSQLLWQRANEIDKLPRYPSNQEEAGKPQVLWARLIVFEGSEAQLAHHLAQSVFPSSRKMGNVTCWLLEDTDYLTIREALPNLFSKESV